MAHVNENSGIGSLYRSQIWGFRFLFSWNSYVFLLFPLTLLSNKPVFLLVRTHCKTLAVMRFVPAVLWCLKLWLIISYTVRAYIMFVTKHVVSMCRPHMIMFGNVLLNKQNFLTVCLFYRHSFKTVTRFNERQTLQSVLLKVWCISQNTLSYNVPLYLTVLPIHQGERCNPANNCFISWHLGLPQQIFEITLCDWFFSDQQLFFTTLSKCGCIMLLQTFTHTVCV